MKYLIINSVCGTGSTGRICTKRAKELISEGHKVYIAYGRGKCPDEYKDISVRIGCSFSVYLHVLSTRVFDNHGLDWNSYFATKRFIEWVKKYDPDIIWLNNIHGYYINIKLLFDYLSSSGKKVEWTFHDCWNFTGHCSYFTYTKCYKWKSFCEKCPQKIEYPKSILLDKSRRNYEIKKKLFTSIKKENLKIITPSNWLKNLVKESFFKDYEVKAVYNTIDTSIFKQIKSTFKEKYGIQDKKVILGVAAQWTKRKGLDDFIKLSELLDDKFKIVLIGLNNKQIKNMPNNVLGLKHTHNVKELVNIYCGSDYFVNTTYEDNYPSVNIEAEACGCKVISYDTGGCKETIENGIIISTGDIYMIAKKLNEE